RETAIGDRNRLHDHAIYVLVVGGIQLLEGDYGRPPTDGKTGNSVYHLATDSRAGGLELQLACVEDRLEPVLAAALQHDGRASIEVDVQIFVVACLDCELSPGNLSGRNLYARCCF